MERSEVSVLYILMKSNCFEWLWDIRSLYNNTNTTLKRNQLDKVLI